MATMKGKTAFYDYYQELYAQRWESLHQALNKKRAKWLRPTKEIFSLELLSDQKNLLYLDEEHRPLLENKSNGYFDFYAMDPASCIVANIVPVLNDNSSILDMCAAPGGKSLILAQKLQGKGELFCNELSTTRRGRLKNVLHDYLPTQFQQNIKVIGRDATTIGMKYPNYYDAVLLDAPCSSEEHLIHSPTHLNEWTPKRSKKLASLQYSLLCSALLTVKSQGAIIYSTCSINPQENDQVIAKLLKKKNDLIKIEKIIIDGVKSEDTMYGKMFLPDNGSNLGPMYVCKITKV